jgi:hypothetical protein
MRQHVTLVVSLDLEIPTTADYSRRNQTVPTDVEIIRTHLHSKMLALLAELPLGRTLLCRAEVNSKATDSAPDEG